LFAVLETLDNGKPIRETRDIDIPIVVRHFYHHAGWAKLRDTELRITKKLVLSGKSFLEFSIDDARLESSSSFGNGKYSCSETG
jgi:acyl-CoA reductase-like NAD-dependent aldehyde dehydrogenase